MNNNYQTELPLFVFFVALASIAVFCIAQPVSTSLAALLSLGVLSLDLGFFFGLSKLGHDQSIKLTKAVELDMVLTFFWIILTVITGGFTVAFVLIYPEYGSFAKFFMSAMTVIFWVIKSRQVLLTSLAHT